MLHLTHNLGHKRNVLHSRQPLESAARYRHRHRLKSEQSRKKSHKKFKSPKDETDVQGAPKSARKTGVSDYPRSMSDSADEFVSRTTSFKEDNFDDLDELTPPKLKPISEEDVHVSCLKVLMFNAALRFHIFGHWTFCLVYTWLRHRWPKGWS